VHYLHGLRLGETLAPDAEALCAADHQAADP